MIPDTWSSRLPVSYPVNCKRNATKNDNDGNGSFAGHSHACLCYKSVLIVNASVRREKVE